MENEVYIPRGQRIQCQGYKVIRHLVLTIFNRGVFFTFRGAFLHLSQSFIMPSIYLNLL